MTMGSPIKIRSGCFVRRFSDLIALPNSKFSSREYQGPLIERFFSKIVSSPSKLLVFSFEIQNVRHANILAHISNLLKNLSKLISNLTKHDHGTSYQDPLRTFCQTRDSMTWSFCLIRNFHRENTMAHSSSDFFRKSSAALQNYLFSASKSKTSDM